MLQEEERISLLRIIDSESTSPSNGNIDRKCSGMVGRNHGFERYLSARCIESPELKRDLTRNRTKVIEYRCQRGFLQDLRRQFDWIIWILHG